MPPFVVTRGVPQPASVPASRACSAKYSGTEFWFAFLFLNAKHFAKVSSSLTRFVASGVVQPAISDTRGVPALTAKIGPPSSIFHSFHLCEYSGA